MNRTNHIRTYFILAFLLLASFGIASCGSGTSSGTDTEAGAGSVSVLFTDFPTDNFSEIRINIIKIELLSDDGKVTVFSGNKILNLLDLRNETTLFSTESNVPAMSYDKIRLTVTGVELFDKNGMIIDKPLKLPGNGKIDLNPRRPFRVRPGEMLTVLLDLDAEKSVKLDENKNRYIFRPVVFIDIIESVPPEKIIRAGGFISDIDTDGKRFRLCSGDNYAFSCCTAVYVSNETSFFSSEAGGDPVMFEDLVEGTAASVIGFFHIPSALHDAGSCKMALDAVVVEAGEFIKLTGTILSVANPATGQFDFQVDPNQEVDPAGPVKVQIQQGTKIYSAEGAALDESSIMLDRRAEIDGKLLLDPVPDVLNAAFISIDTDSVPLEKLSGLVENKNNSTGVFDIVTTLDTACVEVTGDAQILLITGGDTYMSRIIDFTEFDDGAQADIYGSHNSLSGCFTAKTLVIFGLN